MTFRDEIAAHLPHLRRYARALTGAQDSGDTYVRTTLEALIADPDQFDRARSARIGLFALFHAIWTPAAELNAMGGARPMLKELASPEERLTALAPQNRQALLLTAMEGFTPEETAVILGVTTEQVHSLIASAQDEIEREMASRILIIEDESIIAMHIESLVRGLGHDVIGIAATRRDAVALALRERPGLVLADIQLADNSSGLDAVGDILKSFDLPVIFITAYPERLLTGRRPEPTYLIAKPFLPEAVRAAIGQALFFHPHPIEPRPIEAA